jgi:predicted nucleic acid-binding protein
LQKSDSEFELLPPGKHRTQLEEWLDRDLPAWFDGRVLPVNRSFADRWGVLRAQAQMKGRPLAVVDGLLAATALEHGPTIVSRKVADFSAIGLFVVNPWEA